MSVANDTTALTEPFAIVSPLTKDAALALGLRSNGRLLEDARQHPNLPCYRTRKPILAELSFAVLLGLPAISFGSTDSAVCYLPGTDVSEIHFLLKVDICTGDLVIFNRSASGTSISDESTAGFKVLERGKHVIRGQARIRVGVASRLEFLVHKTAFSRLNAFRTVSKAYELSTQRLKSTRRTVARVNKRRASCDVHKPQGKRRLRREESRISRLETCQWQGDGGIT